MKSILFFPNKLAIALAIAVGCLVAASTAGAAPLPPGTLGLPVPVDLPASGVVLMDTGAMPYAFGAVNTGTIEEIVVKDIGSAVPGVSSANPFGPGTLSFIYQVHVTTGDIARVTGVSYDGFLTDVIQSIPAPPFMLSGAASRTAATADRDVGPVVGFNFVPAIVPDGGVTDTSYELTIRTNALSFAPGLIGLIDGGATTMPGLAPAPEPASIVMLGFGAVGMIGYGWKRRKVIA